SRSGGLEGRLLPPVGALAGDPYPDRLTVARGPRERAIERERIAHPERDSRRGVEHVPWRCGREVALDRDRAVVDVRTRIASQLDAREMERRIGVVARIADTVTVEIGLIG